MSQQPPDPFPMSSYLSSEDQELISQTRRDAERSPSAPASPDREPELSRIGVRMIMEHQEMLDTAYLRIKRVQENPKEDWEIEMLALNEHLIIESTESINSATILATDNIRAQPPAQRNAAIRFWGCVSRKFMAFWRKALDMIKGVYRALVDGAHNMWESVKECFEKVARELVRLWRGFPIAI